MNLCTYLFDICDDVLPSSLSFNPGIGDILVVVHC